MINEIIVDPKIITRISPVSCGTQTRIERIKNYGIKKEGIYLTGDWDLPNQRFVNSSYAYKDYLLFRTNEKSIYDWTSLQNSFIQNGYRQNKGDRYVEVAIGRTGEILLVDGRHRLILAQEMNYNTIPVNVLDVHPEYNFNNVSVIQNKIIPEFLYNMISSNWDKEIIVYHDYSSIKQRYNLVKKHLPLLQGLNVLEIGCNSGMMMWSIMKYANCLIELEKQNKYYQQCLITKRHLNNELIIPLNQSLKDFANDNVRYEPINALYASFVLYHLNNDEVDILKNQIFPQCKIVIIPNRQMERKSRVNAYYLNRDSEIKKLLESCNFKVEIDNSVQDGYSVIIGKK